MPETTVFQSGNSQAVRLPKEFRFSRKTVETFRRGNDTGLREKPRTTAQVPGELLAGVPPQTEPQRLGAPLGPHDLWLAAHGLAGQVARVTGSEREFPRPPGLLFENWRR